MLQTRKKCSSNVKGLIFALILSYSYLITTFAERFTEELLLRPLPNGKILAHFHFNNELPEGVNRHYRVFPKGAHQLVRKFSLQELELTFTQGRWDYARWGGAEGIAPIAAKPAGMELWSRIGGQSEFEVDATWRNLTHALSGMFCSSVNALADPATKVAPIFSYHANEIQNSASENRAGLSNSGECTQKETAKAFKDDGCLERQESSSRGCPAEFEDPQRRNFGTRDAYEEGSVRYGALPREAVCTENLTPWLKLLPCRDKAGLATLLERRRVYGGSYHSLRIYIRAGRPSDESSDGSGGPRASGKGGDVSEKLVLEQTLTLVLGGRNVLGKGSEATGEVSFSKLFGRNLHESCPLAETSRLYAEVRDSETLTRKEFTDSGGQKAGRVRDGNQAEKKQGFEEGENRNERLLNEALPTVGKSLHSEAAKPGPTQTWRTDSGSKRLLDYDLKRRNREKPFDVTFPQTGRKLKQAPFKVSRFVTGHGLERGGIRLELTRNLDHKEATDVRFFQLLPWFIRAYFHTLRLEMDGRHVALSDWTSDVSFVPAVDRKRQAVLELLLRIPANVERVVLSMEFDKGYLRLEEHPPDGDRGFDLPSAVLTFSSASGSVVYKSWNGSGASDSRGIEGRPLLHRLKENLPVRVYTQGLLIPLATPDFSMPYNVITLTSTVIAMIFSSLFNALLRKEDGNAEAEVAEEGPCSLTSEKRRKPTLVTRLLRSYTSVYGACWQRCSHICQ